MPLEPAKITGKQVNLIIAKLLQCGIRGDKAMLEFIEFDCDVEVTRLEDINTGQLDQILRKIKLRYDV